MLALSEGLDISLDRLREVAEADLARNKEAFLETAARLGGPGRDPQQVIAEGKRRHPRARGPHPHRPAVGGRPPPDGHHAGHRLRPLR
jgi:hypothetical protein